MTFSSLITGVLPHHGKYSHREGGNITRMIQHHLAGMQGGVDRLTNPNEKASVTYIIRSDGSIWGQVPEELQPWTSGSDAADDDSITFEVENESFQVNGNDDDPQSWRVSDKALNSLVRLIADIIIRYGLGSANTTTYQGHRQHFPTACPGGYLWHKMPEIRVMANHVISGGNVGFDNEGFLMALPDKDQEEILAHSRDINDDTDAILAEVKAMRTDLNEVVGNARKIVHSGEDIKTALARLSVPDIVSIIPDEIAQEIIDKLGEKLSNSRE